MGDFPNPICPTLSDTFIRTLFLSFFLLLLLLLTITITITITIITKLTKHRGTTLAKKEVRWSVRLPPDMFRYFEEHQDQFDGVKSNMIFLMWTEFKMNQRVEVEKRLHLIEAERLSLQAKLNDFMTRERLTFQIETGDTRATSKFDTEVVDFQKTTKRNWKMAKPFTTLQGKRRTKEQNFHDLMEVPLGRLRRELKLSTGLSDDLLLEAAQKGTLLQTLADLNVGPV